MTEHEVDLCAINRAKKMAENFVLAHFMTPRACEVRPRTLKFLRSAIVLAWPDMDEEEIAVLLCVDDAAEFVHRESRQFAFWWSADLVTRMADALNPDRVPVKVRRAPKPVPAHLLSMPGLPLCGPRQERHVEVVRRVVPSSDPTRTGLPRQVAKAWDPPELHRPLRDRAQRPLPPEATGDPSYTRSALYERRRALAEARA